MNHGIRMIVCCWVWCLELQIESSSGYRCACGSAQIGCHWEMSLELAETLLYCSCIISPVLWYIQLRSKANDCKLGLNHRSHASFVPCHELRSFFFVVNHWAALPLICSSNGAFITTFVLSSQTLVYCRDHIPSKPMLDVVVFIFIHQFTHCILFKLEMHPSIGRASINWKGIHQLIDGHGIRHGCLGLLDRG